MRPLSYPRRAVEQAQEGGVVHAMDAIRVHGTELLDKALRLRLGDWHAQLDCTHRVNVISCKSQLEDCRSL